MSEKPTNELVIPDWSLEKIEERIEEVSGDLEVEEARQELHRRVLQLESLKVANRAPRCCVVKANGQNCKAPAWGGRSFCVFHTKALDEDSTPRLKVSVLESRESVQLALKHIMEQIVSGYISPPTASVLLRAVHIGASTVRPRRVRAVASRVSASKTAEALASDARHPADMTEEELDAEIAEIESQLAKLTKDHKIAD